MNPQYKIILIALSFLAYSAAKAGNPLDDAALSIALQNPAVLADKARAESVSASLSAENALAGPELDFDYKFAGHEGVENKWGFSIGQSFDWPGVYSSRRHAASQRSSAFELLYLQTLADKAYEARLAIIDYLAARENMRTMATVVEEYEKLDKLYDKVLERGEITILDSRKLKIRLFDAACSLSSARSDIEAAEAALRTMTADGEIPDLSHIALSSETLKPYQVYHDAMLALNPGIKAYETLAGAAAEEVGVAKKSSLPSFKLSYAHDYEEGVHFNGFGVSIALPSWSPSKKVKAAKAEALVAQNEAVDYRLRASAELQTAYSKASGLATVLGKAGNIFDGTFPSMLEKSLRLGQISLYTYLNEYGDYISAKLDYITLTADYARACAAVGRYTLTPIDNNDEKRN